MRQEASNLGLTRDWEALPLFPELAPCQMAFGDNCERPFDDPFLAELVETQPVQRLKNIGFLGAIDYVRYGNGRESHRRRHNRYDHSIGVAQLALLYAEIRGLSLVERRILAAAGLLHDIGHGPLSHTLEPVFEREFGVSHHKAGENILYGKSPFGSILPKIMLEYQVDLDEVKDMIEGVHNGPHSFLFSSPINLDTIEGITRSRSFFSAVHTKLSAWEIVAKIARSPSLPVATLDAFWSLKDNVYNTLICQPNTFLYDGLAQAYMQSEIARFKPEDFLRTEDQLRHREPLLFHMFAWAKNSSRRVRYRLASHLLDYKIRVPQRSFNVDYSTCLNNIKDLNLRYRQTKKYRDVAVTSLLPKDLEAM